MQHVRYPNVFGLGDACSTPNSKTAAAVRKQAPVVVRNILKAMKAEAADAGYDGYASTPARFSNGRRNCAWHDDEAGEVKRGLAVRPEF
jgi:sulfide:quinone oxidoreductase